MDRDTVLTKTEQGKEEMATRRSLPLDLRRVLILVDGHSTLAEVMDKGKGIPNLEESLDKLKLLELISASGTSPGVVVAATTIQPVPVKQMAVREGSVKLQLARMANNLLGAQAEKIVKKIEEAGDTNEALISAIEVCGKVIRLVIDEKKAEVFILKGKEILSAKK